MLYAHPSFQILAILLAFYVFYLGAQRFRSSHLHQRAVFKWKQHVLLGKIVLGALFVGLIGGVIGAYIYRHIFLISRIHAFVGLILAPLIIIGFITGLYLDAKKGKYRSLVLFHGINNLIVLLLCISQAISGVRIL